jgi:hypothetical protein
VVVIRQRHWHIWTYTFSLSTLYPLHYPSHHLPAYLVKSKGPDHHWARYTKTEERLLGLLDDWDVTMTDGWRGGGRSTVTGLRTGLSLYLAHDISRTIYGGVEALVVDKIAYIYLLTALGAARARGRPDTKGGRVRIDE